MTQRVQNLIPVVLSLVLLLAQTAFGVVYVKQGTATQDGDSWETAYHSIQAGLNDAVATGEDVWVAHGTYVENITLKQAVDLYGGYEGSGTTRDIALYETIIDGTGSTVVTGANSATIEGFTIRNGNYGIYANSTAVAVSNNKIENNNSAGIYMNSVSPVITGNTLRGNEKGVSLMYVTSPILTNNTFTDNTGYAVELYTNLSGTFTATGNTAAGNGVNGIVFNIVNAIGSVTLHPSQGMDYVVKTLTVGSGNTLTVEPGTVLKFLSDSYLTCSGTFAAQGTSASPIYFTSVKDDSVGMDADGVTATPARGDWRSLNVSGASASAALEHCVMRYGGNLNGIIYASLSGRMALTDCSISESKTNGISCKTGIPSISNVNVSNCTQDGFYFENSSNFTLSGCTANGCTNGVYAVNSSSVTLSGNTLQGNEKGVRLWNSVSPTLTENTFTGNTTYAAELYSNLSGDVTASGNTATGNGVNGIVIDQGTINGNLTLHPSQGMTYVVNYATVQSGNTLTIEPGTVVKFLSQYSNLACNGTLIAQGTVNSPIYFTSLRDDTVGGDTDGTSATPAPRDWRYLNVTGTGATATLERCVLRYGGYQYGTIWCQNSGQISVTNCTLTYSGANGINSSTTGNTIRNSIIAYNTNYGLNLTAGSAQVLYCDLWGNSGNALGASTVTTGTIEQDPQLVDMLLADYRLLPGSPCIDSGDPSILDADGSVSDMGALPPWPCVSYAKSRADDVGVEVVHAVVIGGTDIFGAFAYIEDWDRMAGIKVISSTALPTGKAVELAGQITTIDGERVINLNSVSVGETRPLPGPFGMPNRSLGGGDWRYDPGTGAGQVRVAGGTGMNNIGLLVRVWGAFTYIDDHTFEITDGSGATIKCVAPNSVTIGSGHSYVAVTGIVSTEMTGGELKPVILLRYAEDMIDF